MSNGAASSNGGNGGRLLQRGELGLRLGRDSNLDRSPVLDGITLTSPDGPIDLPLAIPLRPRVGQAAVLDLAWRVAYDSGDGALWQWGVAAAARHAPTEPGTDWQYLQVRGDHWRAWGTWRTQLQLGAGRSAGPLGEPYSVVRLGAALERDFAGCTHRIGMEAEARRQQTSSYLDGNLWGALFSSQCDLASLSALRGWRLGAEMRASTDRPLSADRPGGRQQQLGLTLKLAGTWGPVSTEASATSVSAKDQDGYSPLLENNARRNFRQHQFQLEISYRVLALGSASADAFLQWSDTRQTSNISLFANSGSTTYAGVRWRW